MAPRIDKRTPIKLLAIFLVEIFLIAIVFIAAAHGPFIYQNWTMHNGRQLFWEVSLHRIYSNTVCTGQSEFTNLCLSTFKRTEGPIGDVADMICDLERGHPPASEQLQESIKRISESCGPVRRLESYSLATFCMVLMSGAFLSFSLISLLRWCYASFDKEKKKWYIIPIMFLVFDLLMLLASVVVYGIGLGNIGGIFYYSVPGTHESLIHPTDSGSFGWGFWLLVVAILLHVFLIIGYVLWVPRGIRLDPKVRDMVQAKSLARKKLPKETAGKPAKRRPAPARESPPNTDIEAYGGEPSSGDKKVFWAYMPEVFQPTFGGDDHYLEGVQAYEEQVGLLAEHQTATHTTGYGTVTTTYLGEPTSVTTTYVPQPDGTYVTYHG